MISLDEKYYRWRCDCCNEVHDDEDDARDCCRPTITEGCACPVCDAFHREEEDAIACCKYDPEHDDEPDPLPTAEELEAMGQQRLFW